MGCLNLTDGNTTSAERNPFSVQISVLLTVLVCILILFTVFGNVMVVIAVTTCRALKAPQNLFLVSLACADILVTTLVMPFTLANELMGYWCFGKVWCEVHLALDVFFCTSSIVHLCAISLDRYWSVTKAIKYNLKRTPRRIKCTIGVVWVLAAIISIPPLITMTKDDGGKNIPVCKINEEKWYIIFSSVASFLAPCIIMITVYARIYQVAKVRTRGLPRESQRKNYDPNDSKPTSDPNRRQTIEFKDMNQEQRRGENELEEEETSSSNDNENAACSPTRKKNRMKNKMAQAKQGEEPLKAKRQSSEGVSKWKGRQYRERRFTFVLAVVMGVFVLCWFPFFFTYTLAALCDSCCVPETLFKTFFWFGYCNSSLNPVIYTIFNKDFRKSFKKILCKGKRRF